MDGTKIGILCEFGEEGHHMPGRNKVPQKGKPDKPRTLLEARQQQPTENEDQPCIPGLFLGPDAEREAFGLKVPWSSGTFLSPEGQQFQV